MSKARVIQKIVDATGTTWSKASRLVDDVGADRASRLVDEASNSGSSTISNWWKPAAGAGAIGGGAAWWKSKDVEEAKHIANQNQSLADAVSDIMDSDMSAAAKQSLVDALLGNDTSSGDDGDGAGILDMLGIDVELDATTVVLGVIAIIVVLAFVSNSVSTLMPTPQVSAGVSTGGSR